MVQIANCRQFAIFCKARLYQRFWWSEVVWLWICKLLTLALFLHFNCLYFPFIFNTLRPLVVCAKWNRFTILCLLFFYINKLPIHLKRLSRLHFDHPIFFLINLLTGFSINLYIQIPNPKTNNMYIKIKVEFLYKGIVVQKI